ncbi:hypothetical protein Mvan_1658 [Mycolicibacterium vanbaalenii PYR-1]|uniref:Uncharacterized protein n=1 Tax=Mycolicibacterium vanbaalenii (strain DSM 7251 / JCM 13017 / BCRC 16820 / KCTC 9966 / NRRL B-24157 / PYR-1) TaxID=350058 RepID=A1T5N7_MYCVP|nr:hypothetical protein Mvan_1658 [Mycolicibacterium vanbaalenii PYR-1]
MTGTTLNRNAQRVWPTPLVGYDSGTMKTTRAAASLHHRRQDQECGGIKRHARQQKDRENDPHDHQDAAQRVGVLVHGPRLPRTGRQLTEARSVHG